MKLDDKARQAVLDEQITRRDLTKRGAAVAATASFTGLLSACSLGGDETTKSAKAGGGAPVRGGRLRLGTTGAPNEKLSPLRVYVGSERARSDAIFEPLVRYSADSPETPGPWLGESIEASSDASSWQIKLRAGVEFHNGKPLTADDVIYTLGYWLDPKNASDEQASLEPYIDLERTKRVDDLTVELALKRPNAILDQTLNFVYVVPDKTKSFDPPVGTGPFRFESWQRGRNTQMVKNRNWWREDRPYLDEYEIVVINDPQARISALSTGQIDVMDKLEFSQARTIEGNSALKLLRAPGVGCVPFYVRLDSPEFRDSRVRTALKLAIDREQMLENVLLGYGSVGNDLFGKGFPSYAEEISQRTYDPEQAKSLLAAAGAADLEVQLVTSKVEAGVVQAATTFAEQAKAAGISIKVREVPSDQYYAGQYYGVVPFAQTQWFDGTFESLAPSVFTANAPYNETIWKRQAWDRRYYEATAIVDANRRNAEYQSLQEEVWEEGGYIIWGFRDTLDATRANVNGIPTWTNCQALGRYDLSGAWLSS